MLALTSLNPSPLRTDVQRVALQSWADAGLTPVVLQHESEVEVARAIWPMTEACVFGLPEGRRRYLLPLSLALTVAASVPAPVALLNSDCEMGLTRADLEHAAELANRGGMVLLCRWNYRRTHEDAVVTPCGIDGYVFRSSPALADWFRGTALAIGAPWWDIALPVVWRAAGSPLYRAPDPALWHLRHHHWWTTADWQARGEECRLQGLVDLPGERMAKMRAMTLLQAELWSACLPFRSQNPAVETPAGRIA